MSKKLPLIDSFGNLNLHTRDDLVVEFKPGANFGTFAGRTLIFEIAARRIRHTLVTHPTSPEWLLLNIPAVQLRAVTRGDTFVLFDATAGSRVLWEGSFASRRS